MGTSVGMVPGAWIPEVEQANEVNHVAILLPWEERRRESRRLSHLVYLLYLNCGGPSAGCRLYIHNLLGASPFLTKGYCRSFSSMYTVTYASPFYSVAGVASRTAVTSCSRLLHGP